jgi:hypothetical protein
MVKFTYCKNFAHAETKDVPWDDFTRVTSKSVGYDTKEESIKRAAIIGGIRADETTGRAENIATRTMASLDYDDLPDGTTLDDIELALRLGLDCGFITYTTFRHTPSAPRFRVFVPLSREVLPAEYKDVVDDIREAIGLDGLDKCSYTVNQIMFLASHRNGTQPWHLSQPGEPWPVSDAAPEVRGGVVTLAGAVDELDDLIVAIANEPLDITADQVDSLLANYEATTCDYDEWARVGMALAHQFKSSDEGFSRWVEWSKLDAERFNSREMRTKWRSFGGASSPVTMASVIKAAGGMRGGAVVTADSAVAMSLEAEAEAVSDRETYSAFKRRVQALNEMQLSPDIRSLLAKTVYEGYAKGVGMGLRELKTSFKPVTRGRSPGGEANALEIPRWLEGWCYHTADNLFVNVANPALAINDRGFSAKFAHESEVLATEMRAADFGINHVHIPTVDRMFFMPDTTELFCERNGFQALNTYRRCGVTPCETLEGDADAQGVVDLFLKHIAWTFPNKTEQAIVLDWMAHVYQNPGQRVNWALLIWGVQGSGKTLLFNILQRVIGSENTKDVSPSSLKTDYNDWAVGGIVGCVEEIRVSGNSKWTVMDIMKPAITNDLLAINPKGKTSYSGAPNFCSYMMLTNHQDAIPVNDADRRFCVLFSAHNDTEAMEVDHGGAKGLAEYFRQLFDGCVTRRPDAMARFLCDYKISAAFDHRGRAPRTEGFRHMVDANISDEQSLIHEMIDDHQSGILCGEMICVTELKAQAVLNGEGDLPPGRLLGQLLREMGYKPVAPRYYRVRGLKHYVWTKPARISEDEAKQRTREFYEGDSDFVEVSV